MTEEKKDKPVRKPAHIEKRRREKAKKSPAKTEKKESRSEVLLKQTSELNPPVGVISVAKAHRVSPPSAEELEKEYSSEEFQQALKMYENTIQEIQEGEIVKGKILALTEDFVLVDVGFKSEGVIPISEFQDPKTIEVGNEIDVFLEAIEDLNGQLVLSKQKADFIRIWDLIREAQEKGTLIEGKIIRRIKGGMVVSVLGVEAFLPGSQIALRQVPDFDALVGQTMPFKVIKINKLRRNIVVSRRAVLEEEREQQKAKLVAEIEVGQVRQGVVKNITDFGVFMDLGGVDGLLHITDMSWGRISHPSEMVALGDKIQVKILDIEKNTGRISLGLKQLSPYPWEKVEERYPVGKKVRGKVVSITDYGAFVELEKGIEGLMHISEMSWTQHIKHPSKMMQIGDVIEAVVLSVDKANEKISLGIKQMEPDPWQKIEEKYALGSKVSGKVRNLTNFGVFIELEEGIDGMIHISDMSWTKRISHPSELLKKNDRVEVVILNIDKENRRISLGLKQLKEDPWPRLATKFRIGTEAEGKIVRLTDKGVIVELEEEVEGFVPTGQLGKPDLTKPQQAFTEGETLPLKVIEFDQPQRKIVLSVDAYYQGKERTELEKYLASHPTRTLKMEELVPEIPVPKIEEEKKSPSPEIPPPPLQSETK